MPLGELFLGAFLGGFFNVLLDRLTSPELVQFLRQEGFETKIKNWEETLNTINALLGDAEKQLTTDTVKKWLDDLEDLAYDAEDMLDEFEYEATARKIRKIKMESSMFWKHLPAGFCNWNLDAIRFRLRMGSMVNDVNTRFDNLCKRRQDLGLQVNREEAASTSSRSSAAPQRPPTSSLLTERVVFGRRADEEKILEMVLKNEATDSNILVISIVGMGGVGKTTLAQKVYNHEEVKSFEVKAWVCVSDGVFDVTRISMSILQDITGSALEQKNFNTLHKELKQKIDGKRFLLVLDDVWSINPGDWDKFQSPFLGSALGSRIIVTTRSRQVASTFTPNSFLPLGVLSDEDCWSLFLMCMYGKKEAVLAHPRFKLIRKNVIEKCKGLPLAAKALGGLLHSKQIDEWLKILNSGLWDLLEKERPEIPTAVKLSYYFLPPYLRRCFAYCSIFPKDYEFEIKEVVLLWIAEGLIQQSTKNDRLENLGCEYFDDLLERSLFQQSSSYNVRKFVMHDLIHDLAQWAFGERSLRLDGVSTGQSRGLKRVRHFSYTSEEYDGEKIFQVIGRDEDLKARIRTFLSIPQDDYNSVPFDLLSKLKRLRVLSLQKNWIAKVETPIPIGGLKHLRYLNLSKTKIKSLSESTSLLYNLQILILRYCFLLEKLPSNFKFLIKLRHLDIKGAILIEEMPLGMEDLKNLQKLSHFIVGRDGVGSSLKDLMSLRKLHGKLCITELDNVVDCDHKYLILSNKEDLKKLWLGWGSQFHESRHEATEEKVLDMLRPHENLQKLTISCYGGTRFPSWVGAASYSNMKVLRLKNCEKCICLPSLGELVSLEELIIKGMKGLTRISSEFYGNGPLFKSLKTLCFEDLLVWAGWEPIEENEYGDAFPCLHKLSIKKCPQLSGSLPKCLFALEELVIKACEQLVVSFSNSPKLCKIDIDGCKRIACDNPVDFKSIRYLSLSNISEFSNQLMQECFGKVELQQINLNSSDEICPEKPLMGRLQSIRSLTELFISECPNIISFPEVCFLPYLTKLGIRHCNALISLPEKMNTKNACLWSLAIERCDSLTFIVRGQLPPSLKCLFIIRCKKLESLWDDREGSCSSTQGNNTNSCLLESLSVHHCPSLTCIQLPATLKYLRLSGCPYLTKLPQSGQLPASLKDLNFGECEQLTIMAEGFLDSNTSLESIYIWDCENLQMPSGLHNLRHLQDVTIGGCPSIEFLSQEGLANTNLRRLLIRGCNKLRALPVGLRSLKSLEDLTISRCPNITSFNPEEEFPTNLKSLEIGGCENVYRPLVEWGLDKLSSLTSLEISGCADVELFPLPEMKMMLPPSLTDLTISGFPKLKQLCSQSIQNLTSLQSLRISLCTEITSLGDQGLPSSLESLEIWSCPALTCFPKQGLPSSLESLSIWSCPALTCFPKQGLPSSLHTLELKRCPKLEEECKRKNGREWSKISNILRVTIGGRELFELDDEKAQSSSWYRWSCLTNPMHCCKSTKDDTLEDQIYYSSDTDDYDDDDDDSS